MCSGAELSLDCYLSFSSKFAEVMGAQVIQIQKISLPGCRFSSRRHRLWPIVMVLCIGFFSSRACAQYSGDVDLLNDVVKAFNANQGNLKTWGEVSRAR